MKKIYEDIKKVFDSKASFRILLGLGILLVSLLIFAGGMAVGVQKATYGIAWERHYDDNFGILPPRRMPGLAGTSLPTAHGAAGKIIKVELPNVIVEDRDNTEKTILIAPDTKIQRGRENIMPTDLNVNDFVITIGTPDGNGIIEAKFVRVIPSPELLDN